MYLEAITNFYFSLFFTSWGIEKDYLILNFEIQNNKNFPIYVFDIYLKNENNVILIHTDLPPTFRNVILDKDIKPLMFHEYIPFCKYTKIDKFDSKFFTIAFKKIDSNDDYKNCNIYIKVFETDTISFHLIHLLINEEHRVSRLYPNLFK